LTIPAGEEGWEKKPTLTGIIALHRIDFCDLFWYSCSLHGITREADHVHVACCPCSAANDDKWLRLLTGFCPSIH
jgi:hypothetical protein